MLPFNQLPEERLEDQTTSNNYLTTSSSSSHLSPNSIRNSPYKQRKISSTSSELIMTLNVPTLAPPILTPSLSSMDPTTHEQLVIAFNEYLFYNSKFEKLSIKTACVKSRKALIDVQKLILKRRAEMQQEKKKINKIRKNINISKMKIQELRELVIEKGLCSDPSKLIKSELFKLLKE